MNFLEAAQVNGIVRCLLLPFTTTRNRIKSWLSSKANYCWREEGLLAEGACCLWLVG